MHARIQKPRILLVDDEADICTVIALSLEDLGYEVEIAGTGETALECFDRSPPDIVLTDIKMPGMDGIDLLQQIRRRDPEMEVIMITGHGDMDLAIKSIKHEASDFITKPIDEQILRISLKRALERIRMRRRVREYTENLEQLVREKSQQLLQAERMAAVGQTVADLAHTIKNLVGGLRGSLFVLGKGIELEEKAYLNQGWEMVQRNLKKIQELSLGLLDYGRYQEIHPRPCDPNQPVMETAALLQARAKDQGIALNTDLAVGAPPIPIDPDALQRALLNLVTNALEAFETTDGDAENFQGKGRYILLKTESLPDGGVAYLVRDSAGGMNEAVRESVFQPYSIPKWSGGSGLGLLLTRKIVEQHGGTIELDSRAGEGSQFTIRIPAPG